MPGVYVSTAARLVVGRKDSCKFSDGWELMYR